MIPEIRQENGMLIGYSRRRIFRSRLRDARVYSKCLFFGHLWDKWQIDDYEGPGVYLDDPDSFVPYLSRESRDDEYGERCCQRCCGALEQRYSLAEAPELWRAERRRQEDAENAWLMDGADL